jgi:hypothetical protein
MPNPKIVFSHFPIALEKKTLIFFVSKDEAKCLIFALLFGWLVFNLLKEYHVMSVRQIYESTKVYTASDN